MIWRPEDEERLRQEALERELAKQKALVPVEDVLDALRRERAEMDRWHEAYAYRMAAEALARVERVISAMPVIRVEEE